MYACCVMLRQAETACLYLCMYIWGALRRHTRCLQCIRICLSCCLTAWWVVRLMYALFMFQTLIVSRFYGRSNYVFAHACAFYILKESLWENNEALDYHFQLLQVLPWSLQVLPSSLLPFSLLLIFRVARACGWSRIRWTREEVVVRVGVHEDSAMRGHDDRISLIRA